MSEETAEEEKVRVVVWNSINKCNHMIEIWKDPLNLQINILVTKYMKWLKLMVKDEVEEDSDHDSLSSLSTDGRLFHIIWV